MFQVHELAAGKAKKNKKAKKNGPVTTTAIGPEALTMAMSAADGNINRLFYPGDGSVIVANSSRRPDWLQLMESSLR